MLPLVNKKRALEGTLKPKEKPMKLYDLSILVICVVAAAALVGTISGRYLGKDNLIEQVAEAVIHQETGLTVDLSPEEEEHAEEEPKEVAKKEEAHPVELDENLKEVAEQLIQEQTQLKADVSPETLSKQEESKDAKVPA